MFGLENLFDEKDMYPYLYREMFCRHILYIVHNLYSETKPVNPLPQTRLRSSETSRRSLETSKPWKRRCSTRSGLWMMIVINEWLIDWLIGLFIWWLIYLLMIDWFIDWLIYWFIDLLIYWFIDLLIYWLICKQ